MRIRATVAAVTGALALSALAAPVAQADNSPSRDDLVKAAQEARHAGAQKSARTGFSATVGGVPYALDIAFSSVKVNSGKPIVVGTSGKKSVPVTFKVTHGTNVDFSDPEFVLDVDIYRGSYADPINWLYGDEFPTCTETSATTATCKGAIDIYPEFELTNSDATTWKIGGWAMDLNGEDPFDEDIDWSNVGYTENDHLGTTKLQRFSKLTVNASPEPVKKGKTLTVTGKLTRADWNTGKYTGLSGQKVSLQFRKSGPTSYKTLKGITSTSGGALKTTYKASYDGYWRFSYAGIASTAAVSAAGDYVDVK